MRKEQSLLSRIDYENMSDEEIDMYFRPRKANTRKSLAPLFIYLILSKQPEGVHLTQRQVAEELENEYGVSIERKALSRILHSLDDAGVGIVSTSDAGTWLDAA